MGGRVPAVLAVEDARKGVDDRMIKMKRKEGLYRAESAYVTKAQGSKAIAATLWSAEQGRRLLAKKQLLSEGKYASQPASLI